MPGNTQASAMIVEDQLKNFINKRDKGKLYKFSDNTKLPKAHDSVFGNFPSTHKQGLGALGFGAKRLSVAGATVVQEKEIPMARQSKY